MVKKGAKGGNCVIFEISVFSSKKVTFVAISNLHSDCKVLAGCTRSYCMANQR